MSRLSEKVLTNLRTKCRTSENRLLTSLRKLKSLVPNASACNVTPLSEPTSGSVDDEILLEDPNPTGGVQGRTRRLQSDASTTPLWSGDETPRKVNPLEVVSEEGSHDSEVSQARKNSQQTNLRERDRQPFYIYEEFRRLRKRHEDFESASSNLLDALQEDDPVATKVQGKVDHYGEVCDTLETDMTDYIWEI